MRVKKVKISNGVNKIAKAENWQYSSYPDYLGKRNGNLCDKNVILTPLEMQHYLTGLRNIC